VITTAAFVRYFPFEHPTLLVGDAATKLCDPPPAVNNVSCQHVTMKFAVSTAAEAGMVKVPEATEEVLAPLQTENA
jgi:hypothetical protein